MAASRKIWESRFDGRCQFFAAAAEQRAKPTVEAELAPVLTDKVENSADGFVVLLAQAPSELLQEQHRAVGRA